MSKAIDTIQQRLTDYACNLDYGDLPPQTIHAAKARIIDTLGALVGGFFGEPCRIARNLAAQAPDSHGATVIGTRIKTAPDMAAFVNATTGRYLELMDSYHWPGSLTGHASDTVASILAAAEYAQVDGRKFITAVVLAYEVFLRICDALRDLSFDNTNFACLGTAIAAGKLFGLSSEQL
jgi:2-methylcitrate dehydratase